MDGTRVAYRAWGPPAAGGVVAVHGGAAHARWWDHIGPLLAAERRVVAIDLSGHGDSGWRDTYRLEQWADEVLAVAEAARVGPRPVVIGHSMGGMVALTAGRLHAAALDGVVAVDTPVRERSPEDVAAREHRAFGPRRVYPTREQALANFRTVPPEPNQLPYVLAHVAETSVCAVDGGWSWKFDRRVFNRPPLTPSDLGVLDCRVGLFRGEHGLVSARMGELVVDRLGRAVPMVAFPVAGHHMMFDQPLALVTGLRTLLADWQHSTATAPTGEPAHRRWLGP